jgi:hypothetical protein
MPLTHRGRRTGRLIQMMLEVIGERPVEQELFVMVGLGRRAQLPAPIVRATLSRLTGWRYDGTPTARERLVSDHPILAFRPAPLLPPA